MMIEESDVLRVPKGRFQEIIRRLAEAAMQTTHHDASETEVGYIHEVQSMERKFTAILRGKIRKKAERSDQMPDTTLTPAEALATAIRRLRALGFAIVPVAGADPAGEDVIAKALEAAFPFWWEDVGDGHHVCRLGSFHVGDVIAPNGWTAIVGTPVQWTAIGNFPTEAEARSAAEAAVRKDFAKPRP